MPINAESYKNAKVYRIWSLLGDKIYIGSTADTLSNRLGNHKSSYKRWLKDNNRQYTYSFKLFEMFGVDNCKIDLEHNFSCNSKAELKSEEGRVQRIHKAILVNNNIAGRTQEERYAENKEYYKEYNKQHNRQHYAENKDAILEKQKQYYTENKDYYKNYNKEYKSENKEAVSKQRNEKFVCECGGRYTQQHKTHHLNSVKHQKFITDNQSAVVAC